MKFVKMDLLNSCLLILLLLFKVVFCEWSEEQFQMFERDLIELADSYFPFEVQHKIVETQQHQNQMKQHINNQGKLWYFRITEVSSVNGIQSLIKALTFSKILRIEPSSESKFWGFI